MGIHSFGWRDLPSLYRYRAQVLCLDSALWLTRGSPLQFGNLLTSLNPGYGVYTAVYTGDDGQGPLLGQIRYPMRAHSARLSFLAPGDSGNLIALPGLVEHMAVQAGEWGAMHLIAEVDEHTLVFDGLRRAGFSIYAWQRVWQFPVGEYSRLSAERQGKAWTTPEATDNVAIKNLHQSVVPALIQPVEPLNGPRGSARIYRDKGELSAYASIRYGSRGIWVQPFIHPATDDVPELLLGLLAGLPLRASRPVYICVRSYQAWLESALEELSARVGPRQAMLVKHLAILKKLENAVPLRNMEKSRVKPSTPIARSQAGPVKIDK